MGLSDAPNDQLMRALKFNIKDLDSNRDGLLAKGQHKRVRQWQFSWSVALVAVTLLLLGMMVLFTRSFFISAQFWILIVILPVALGLFWFQQRTLRILTRGKVAASYGRVRVIQDLRSYLIEIQNKRFRLDGESAAPFVTGEVYTVYYLPGLDYLLSAEHHVTSVPHQGQRPRSMQKRTEPIERTLEERPKWRGKGAIEVHEDRHSRHVSKATRAPRSPMRDVRPQLKQRSKEHRGR